MINEQAMKMLARGPAFCRPAPLLLRSRSAKAKAQARQRRRRSAAFPAAAAPSSSSDSSSFSSSSIAQMAPTDAFLLRGSPESIGGTRGSGNAESGPSRVDVVVLGVDHGDPDPLLGSFILSASPAAVVVETALCGRHGKETGTSLSLAEDGSGAGFGGGGGARWETKYCDEVAKSAASDRKGEGEEEEEEPHVVQCLSLAERLSSLPDSSPERTAFWQALSQHFAGEQLAYVASLSKGARVVFGDRPKRETVRRLAEDLSAADLDAAVAAQASSNTLECLTGSVAPPPPLGGGRYGRAYNVLVRERDAVICSVVAAEVEREMARRRRGRGSGESVETDIDDASSSSASTSTSFAPSHYPSFSDPRPILVVVGKWHLEGVRSLWESGEWRRVLEDEEAAAAAEAMPEEGAGGGGGGKHLASSPARRHVSLSAAEDLGLRRALVDELLWTTATAGSAEEVDPEAFGGAFINKGETGEEEREEEKAQRAFALTTELYGTARMQLALLDSRSEFDAVVSGWRCDFWEVVEPLRAVRAANGGRGFDEVLVMSLRGLNFIFG